MNAMRSLKSIGRLPVDLDVNGKRFNVNELYKVEYQDIMTVLKMTKIICEKKVNVYAVWSNSNYTKYCEWCRFKEYDNFDMLSEKEYDEIKKFVNEFNRGI